MNQIYLLMLLIIFSGTAQSIEFVKVPNSYIVKFKSSNNLIQTRNLKEIKLFGSEFTNIKKITDLIYSVEFPIFISGSNIVNEIKNNSNLLWIEQDIMAIGDARETIPNDQFFEKQYHHKLLNSVEAWEINPGDQSIIVAVTDDGFQLDHNDLKNVWARNENEIPDNGIDDDQNGYIDDSIGWDFSNNDNDPSSSYSYGAHGTHVAGIIAAEKDNSIGVVGMFNGAKVMPLKFYGKGSWTASVVLESYKYAADNGARVISTSYNIDGMAGNKIYQEALNYAASKDVLVFNSAGNGNKQNSSRSNEDNVILVASLQSGSDSSKWDIRSRFSNYGTKVDIAAPGDPIYSTVRHGKYMDMSGTSMATPVVAGAAAYVWSLNPEFTREQVIAALLLSSKKVDDKNPSYINQLGAGRISLVNIANENYRRTELINPIFLAGTKKIKVKIDGVFSKKIFKSRSNLFVVKNTESGEILSNDKIKLITNYEIGTNILEFNLNSLDRGKYELFGDANLLIDPFGNPMERDFSFDFRL